jgi:ribosomal-protein-serine acetyltransferase
MRFSSELGRGYALALRTVDSIDEMHALTIKNLPRLRAWEPWAQGEQTVESTASFTRYQLGQFIEGSVIPCVITHDGIAIGSATLKVDGYLKSGELGYWIDESAEGQGVVTLACTRLIEHAGQSGIRRLEIRTASRNSRSIAVAERLGFEPEGVLRQALPIGSERLDVSVYGRVL